MTPETQAALALVDAGVPRSGVDRVLRTLDVGPADTAESITQKVDALKADLPGLFTATPAPRPARLRSVPSGRSFEEIGEEALAKAGITSATAQQKRARGRFAKTQRPAGRPGGDAA